MDVKVIGKALTPIGHERLFHVSYGTRDGGWETQKMPMSRHYADLKSMQLYQNEVKHKHYLNRYDTTDERSRMNLSPIFRSMTLSETYSFARAQLKKNPSHMYNKRKHTRTPKSSFPKVDRNNWDHEETYTPDRSSKEIQSNTYVSTSRSDTLQKSETSLIKPKSEPVTQNARRTKSTTGRRKHRKNTGRRKKNSQVTSQRFQNELSKTVRTEPVPLARTSTSVSTNLNISQAKHIDQSRTSTKPAALYRGSTLHLPQTRQSPKKYAAFEIDDPLLCSFDPSRNSKKGSRELSMRIQLIHRYGNEDVIDKHMEMKKKREIAYKLEVKNLEQQSNERKKQNQRRKIYALNKLMTKLEQEQFEEYKQSL